MNKVKLMIAGAVIAVGAFVGVASANNPVNAADCSANAVITCGVTSIGQLRDKFNANTPAGTQNIFSWFGLTSDVVNHATNKTGYVTKSGDVVVDGKVVATNAVSAGRQYMAGSATQSIGGTTFYTRSTQTSFVSSQIGAIVFFDAQGRFIAAVLYDCGNPVKATNKVVPVQPVYKCDSLKATPTNRTTYSFTTAATAKDGAVIKDYVYTFGDGATQTAGASVSHTYAKPGTYTASVTVRVTVNGQVVNAPGSCKTTVTIAPEMCPVPGKEQYPKDDPRCVEDKPAVQIVKTVNDQEHVKVKVGDTFTYQISVKNTGNVILKNLVITDKAPSEVSLIGSNNLGTIQGNTWTYTLPELAIGASKSFTLTAKYTKFTAGTHGNTVCVETPTVPGTNPDDCDTAETETYEYITVCDLTDNTIKTITRDQFDESQMTLDQTKCGQMRVCIIADKTTKDIAKKDFDSTTMTTDMDKCITPPTIELPKTGLEDSLGNVLGLGSIVGASYAFIASRRSLR